MNHFIYPFSTLILLFSFTNSSFANQQPNIQQLLILAQTKNLANHLTWQRLLYYPEQPSNQTSRIINKFNPKENQQKFFISQTGATNPENELKATLHALFDPTLVGDDNIQCRFPARTHWLKQQLSINLPTVNCPTFDQWFQQVNPQYTSIIFANEHLDILPSAFAHSFLHFGNYHNNQQLYLNYTPTVVKGERFLKFSYKSIISGNIGEFSIQDYQTAIEHYTQQQNRDMWHYRLNLTQEQNAQLVRQVWEIKDQQLPYYLLDKNCASEILVLLNTLFPEKNLLENFKKLVAPAQIIRHLQQQGLITDSYLVPAQQTEQQYQRNHPNQPLTTKISNNTSPLLANPLQRMSIGYQRLNQPTNDEKLQIGYRLVYHDMLDKPAGYPTGSYFDALSFTINLHTNSNKNKTQVELEEATLFNLRQLKPINTIKAGNSYGFGLGLQRIHDVIENDNNLVLGGHFEYGKSLAYGKPSINTGELPPNLCYGLANGQLQVGKGLYHDFRLGLGANFGCIHQFTPNFRALINLSLPFWLAGTNKTEYYIQPNISIGSQFDINQHQAIRLTANHDWKIYQPISTKNQTEWTLQYLHYFD